MNTQVQRIKESHSFLKAVAIYEDASLDVSFETIQHYDNPKNLKHNDLRATVERLRKEYQWVADVLASATKRIDQGVAPEKIEALRELMGKVTQ